MAGEQDAEEVVSLALVPVGARENGRDRGYRRVGVGLQLQPDAHVLVGAEQVVDDLEALLALGIVGPADIDDRDEARLRIVTQQFHDVDDGFAVHLDGQLAERDRLRDNAVAKQRHEALLKGGHVC